MKCATLEVLFASTNQLQALIAQRNVLIQQQDAEFQADTAVYTETNGLLRLTGNPSWRVGDRNGKGEVLEVDAKSQQVRVLGNASMRLPSGDLVQPGATTPALLALNSNPAAVPPPGKAPPASLAPEENKTAEVFSDNYSLGREQATFSGGVYISHPRMAWACETLTIRMSPEEKKVSGLVARDSVAFDLMVGTGQQIRGRADQASYRYEVTPTGTNDTMELTGNPVLETTNMTFRNSVFIIDRANNTLTAPGRYRLRGTAPGFDTNMLNLPDTSSLRPRRSSR